jgi:hypothetical protein
VLAPFVATAIVGMLVGKSLAERLSGATLTRAFAAVLVVVGLAVAAQSALAP